MAASLHAQNRSWSEPCEAETSTVATEIGRFTLPNRDPIQPYEILTLFRFHRQQEALARLDAAQKLLAGPFRWRVPPDQHKDASAAVAALRKCISTQRPAALGTLTVRTFELAAGNRRVPLPGVRISVEERSVGTTRRDGSLTVPVASGAIRVTGRLGGTNAGEGHITLAPGRAANLAIIMDPDKEGYDYEDFDLVVAEAVDDIIPISSSSFTLKFMRDGRAAPIAKIQSVELRGREDEYQRDLKEFFDVAGGVLKARKSKDVFDALAGQFEETIKLSVEAADSQGRTYWSRVGFRVGQSRLTVTLAAPPSNPSLPLANIEVGVSLAGAGVAVRGVSDAGGRFTIDSFPPGNVDFDCETTFQGEYYYGEATMSLSGPDSITLVLRNLKDIINGVPPKKR